MKQWYAIFVIVVFIILGAFVYSEKTAPVKEVASFDACVEAGYPVMESYPAQCKTPHGTTFKQDIGNELEMADVIRIDTPRPHMTITSPLTITGTARGMWYFEASFPVKLLDAEGNILTQTPAQGEGEWMTEEFVLFKTEILFTLPQTKTGTLVLEKDNPSGLPEHDAQLRIPIRFQ